MKPRSLLSVFALTLPPVMSITACGASSEFDSSGITEPIQVLNGQFFRGDFAAGTAGPAVLAVNVPNTMVRQGQAGWGLTGDTPADTWAIALRFADLGSGYWVVPVGLPDIVNKGNVTWSARVDFSRDVPPGSHELHILAVEGDQTFGPLVPAGIRKVNVLSLLPNADVVLSLEWDTDADLDLHLVGPLEEGMSELYPKQLSTSPFDTASSKFPPGTGLLDRDSNARCVRDGFRREDVVWSSHEAGATAQGPPRPGNYLIRVDMFDACSQAYANFKVTLFDQGTPSFSKVGRLLSTDADAGGAGSGLFVAQIQF
jgi:hypothetical protein